MSYEFIRKLMVVTLAMAFLRAVYAGCPDEGITPGPCVSMPFTVCSSGDMKGEAFCKAITQTDIVVSNKWQKKHSITRQVLKSGDAILCYTTWSCKYTATTQKCTKDPTTELPYNNFPYYEIAC